MDPLQEHTPSDSITDRNSDTTVDASPTVDRSKQFLDRLILFRATKEIVHINHAIAMMEEIISDPVTSDDGRVWILGNLSTAHFEKFKQFGELDDLEKGIEAGKQAAAGTPPDHPDRMERWSRLAFMFHARYCSLNVTDDLGNTIEASQQALAADSPDHPLHGARLCNLAIYHYQRFQRSGSIDDLHESIKIGAEACETKIPDLNIHARTLCNLGMYCFERFKLLGNLDDVDDALVAAEMAAVIATPSDPIQDELVRHLHHYRHHKQQWLGNSSTSETEPAMQASQPGEPEDSERAVANLEEGPGLTTQDPTKRALVLANLSRLLVQRFGKWGALSDLERAVEVAREGVSILLPDSQDRYSPLESLGKALCLRFKRLGALDDLQEGIAMYGRAVDQIPFDHKGRGFLLMSHAVQLSARYQLLDQVDDLEQAILAGEEALKAFNMDSFEEMGDLHQDEPSARATETDTAAVPLDYDSQSTTLSNLGGFYQLRFMRSGNLEDLEKGIQFATRSVAVVSPDNPSRSDRFANLGIALFYRHKRLNSLDDLENGIQAFEDGLPAFGHKPPPTYYSNWAVLLHSRFERLGVVDNLNQAIEITEKGASEMGADSPDRRFACYSLAILYEGRFKQSDTVQDLEKAISSMAEAIERTTPGHYDLATELGIMSGLLLRRYQRVEELEDLLRAITLSEDAVALTPVDHQSRANKLFTLSKAFYLRSDLLKSLEEQSQNWAHPTTGAGPQDRLDAVSFRKLFYKNSEPRTSIAELNSAIETAVEAWRCHLSPPRKRIRGAWYAGALMAKICRWDEAGSLLANAVRILSTVSLRILNRHDQEHTLSEFSQLPAFAVSIAFQAGSTAADGLSLLELSRGIIMGFSIDCRTDLSELRLIHPYIFDRFDRLRIEIDLPLGDQLWRNISPQCQLPGIFAHHNTEDQRRRRALAINEIEETLVHIRQLPGFEGFQLPPSATTLMTIAAEGPIITFNCSEFRSDAIILTSSGIKLLPLPKMVFSTAVDLMGQLRVLRRGKRSTFVSRNKTLSDLLLWLWEVAVLPVFEELGFVAVDDANLPRVWWIGVGILAQAPFHAAGVHSRDSTCNTLSRAISSYIPTIKALSYTRQKSLEINNADSRLLTITTSNTPHSPVPAASKWGPLANAVNEAQEIKDVVGHVSHVTHLDSPSVAQVLSELPSYHAIHFACHGVSDSNRPSDSHLVLVGDNSTEVGKLTVAAVANMNLRNAQIAYLSACSSADNPSAKLLDESIHIASGFQLAGFSHVLATLWNSEDRACRQVAVEFYRLLFNGQPGDQGHRVVSTSFHHAVKRLRRETLEQPIKWVPFIHTGA